MLVHLGRALLLPEIGTQVTGFLSSMLMRNDSAQRAHGPVMSQRIWCSTLQCLGVATQARSQVPLHDVSASSSALPFPVLDDSVGVSWSDVSFVDDFALFVASASPTDLLDNVRNHVRAYSELLADLSLSLNVSPGKTEAFVTFRGKGAKDAASKFVHHDDQSHVPLHYGRLLRIVRSYFHLGSLTTPSGSYAQEVSRRTQSMLHAVCCMRISHLPSPRLVNLHFRSRPDLFSLTHFFSQG